VIEMENVVIERMVSTVGVRGMGAVLAAGMLAVAFRTGAAQASAPTVSVADIIGLTTIGSRVQGYGDEDFDVVSPDGAHVAVVVKRGNLAANTLDYALLVFRTGDLLTSPAADTVARLSSSSNRPGIASVRWAADNATLVFLGEDSPRLTDVGTDIGQTGAIRVVCALQANVRARVRAHARR
jgi:hypothetical protein